MAVECYLSLYLLWLDAAELVGMLFMDEFDGDDGLEGILRTGFADEGVGTAAYRSGDDPKWEVCWEGFALYLSSLVMGMTMRCALETYLGRYHHLDTRF